MEIVEECIVLNDQDLQMMKNICKKILETNLEVKKFQLRHAQKPEHVLSQKESIAHSQIALKKLKDINNSESINAIIRNVCGDSNWATFVNVLGIFSGVLSDEDFYRYDREFTEAKGHDA